MQNMFLLSTIVIAFNVILTHQLDCGDQSGGGCPYPQDLAVKNVALKAAVAQSSQFHPTSGASKLAVDGNRNQNYGGLSCTHTSTALAATEKVPWLRVDLGSPHLVRSIVIYSRNDPCCFDRFHDVQVRVGNNVESGLGHIFSKNDMCGEIAGGGFETGYVYNLTCGPCLVGRYVSVQIVRYRETCSGFKFNILTICELEVYGYPVN